MANKIVKSEVFEINTSLLNKTQRTIYNKVSNRYRFWQIYDFFKFIYKNKLNLFMYLFGVVIITVATRLNTILWLLCRFLNISFLVKILFILYILNSKIYKIKKYGN